MGRIVYAFPGTGKTYLCSKNHNYIELASENFHWLDCEKKEKNKGNYYQSNPMWPNNYLHAIINAKEKYDFIFITHSGCELCRNNHIHYDLVYPSIKCKDEYLRRMKFRGNNDKFIENMSKNFEFYCTECSNDKYADEKIELKPGEYLEDAINKIKQNSPLFDKFPRNNNLITVDNSANCFRKKTKDICEKLESKYALIIFNNNFVSHLIQNNLGKEIGRFYSGANYNPIVLYDNFLIVSSFLGGPNASALMEELVYYGVRYFLAIGTSCCLDYKSKDKLIVVDKAIRDEGTSLFYKDPSLYAYTSRWQNNLLYDILENNGIDYTKGITWTTDAYYMENYDRLAKRIEQGAKCIDMESSIWCSVSEYLSVDFSQILFFTDMIKENKWFKNKSNLEINNEIADLSILISKKMIRKLIK